MGLAWYSHQVDGAVCVLLFGDRVAVSVLQVDAGPAAFAQPVGFRQLLAIADQVDITITEA